MATPESSTAGRQERVTVTVEGGVAEVRLNRPDKLNALDNAMFSAIADAGDALAKDPAVRAVVLSGEGRGFCAGLDLSAFETMGRGGDTSDVTGVLADRLPGRITNLPQQAAYAWSELAVPTIAAVHGVALGGGFQLMLGADLRIVSPDTRLSVLEIRWGFVPDMTGTWVLPRLVGLDVAKELTWTGRMIGGDEAVRIGLATSVADDPRAAALELARQIAAASPDAVRDAKMLLERSMTDTVQEHLLRESLTMDGLIGSPNQREAVLAWFDKRDPVFSDPS